MPRVNLSMVPDDQALPSGYYNLLLAQADKMQTQAGALMYKIEFRVHEPSAQRGKIFNKWLSVGTRPFDPGDRQDDDWIDFADLDDPECQDELNWRMNPAIRELKQILVAAGIDGEQDVELDDIMGQVNQMQWMVCGRISRKVETKGRFEGRVVNELSFVCPIGKEEPRLDDAASVKRPGSRPAARSATANQSEQMNNVQQRRRQRSAESANLADVPVGDPDSVPY